MLAGMSADRRNLMRGRRECGKRVGSTASHSRTPECTCESRNIVTARLENI